MTVIHVPRPSKAAVNLDRPINALLLAQVQHLHEAEQALPHSYRSKTYIRAIKTEGEAAAYVREVTEAIHKAHADAVAARAKRALTQKRGFEIAASAAEPASKPQQNKAKKKTKDRTRPR